jgi:hypothetical protein
MLRLSLRLMDSVYPGSAPFSICILTLLFDLVRLEGIYYTKRKKKYECG